MTAEEFIEQGIKEGLGLDFKNFKEENPVLYATIKSIVLKSTKLHVKAALEAAYNNHVIYQFKQVDRYDYPTSEHFSATKDSILNAYPETNIK